ncbi:hypothetical protein C405_08410 [Stenotrophomonas maltophilia AU12-09]|nr:hypothetical protein C405_08410 [Stenotrophomonas maltophilia AU12-09]
MDLRAGDRVAFARVRGFAITRVARDFAAQAFGLAAGTPLLEQLGALNGIAAAHGRSGACTTARATATTGAGVGAATTRIGAATIAGAWIAISILLAGRARFGVRATAVTTATIATTITTTIASTTAITTAVAATITTTIPTAVATTATGISTATWLGRGSVIAFNTRAETAVGGVVKRRIVVTTSTITV